MSIAIAGLWELGHSAPLTEAGLWSYPLRDFAVDEWHMSPVSGIANEELLTEWDDPHEMIRRLGESHRLVFVTENAGTELADFEHPTGPTCYVFGKATWSPFKTMATENDLSVRIGTRRGLGLLWPHQCMVSVLWHRRQQWL